MTTPRPQQQPGPSAETGNSGLAQRAISCYRAAPPEVGAAEQGWRARAARAVRTLAATIGVDPAHVVAAPDPDRVYGLLAAPEVHLTVTEPTNGGERTFVFVPEYGVTDSFVLLTACPGCAQLVPSHRVATLADLGRHLARRGAPDAEQFASDPAHAPGCSRFRPDPRYATAHRAAPTVTPAASGVPARRAGTQACGCACATGGWCGGCGHAGCSRR